MSVIRWIFDYGGDNAYIFPRNPDRYGGDTYWVWELRANEVDLVGSSVPSVQVDAFRGAKRTIRFTAITGNMKRQLQEFYMSREVVSNCRDHLYPTEGHEQFHCFILSFTSQFHPTIGDFPGSEEDTWDVEMTLLKID